MLVLPQPEVNRNWQLRSYRREFMLVLVASQATLRRRIVFVLL
jgi:hypothetical protein